MADFVYYPVVQKTLKDTLDRCGSQKAWAEAHGLSEQYVSDLANGRREITDKVARLLGYEPRKVYFSLIQRKEA